MKLAARLMRFDDYLKAIRIYYQIVGLRYLLHEIDFFYKKDVLFF